MTYEFYWDIKLLHLQNLSYLKMYHKYLTLKNFIEKY